MCYMGLVSVSVAGVSASVAAASWFLLLKAGPISRCATVWKNNTHAGDTWDTFPVRPLVAARRRCSAVRSDPIRDSSSSNIPYGMSDYTRRALFQVNIGDRRGKKLRHTQRAIVAWELAFGTGAVVWVATDAANIVVGHVPPPSRYGVPLLDRHLHRVSQVVLFRKCCLARRVRMEQKLECRVLRGSYAKL